MSGKPILVAIVNHENRKPEKSRQECSCPHESSARQLEDLEDLREHSLEKETTHRYSANFFKLHRGGHLLHVGDVNRTLHAPPDWQEILTCFRGSELQNYFTKVLEHDLKAIIKPQYVDQIPKTVKGSVGSILARKDETKTKDIVHDQLGPAD
ncbi:ATP-binding cassette sub-family E member 1 [Arapaima gigas]